MLFFLCCYLEERINIDFTGTVVNAVFDGAGIVDISLDKIDNGKTKTITIKNDKLSLVLWRL